MGQDGKWPASPLVPDIIPVLTGLHVVQEGPEGEGSGALWWPRNLQEAQGDKYPKNLSCWLNIRWCEPLEDIYCSSLQVRKLKSREVTLICSSSLNCYTIALELLPMIGFGANCPLKGEEASHWALPGAVPMSIHGSLPRRCCGRQLPRWSQWSPPPGIHTCLILSLWITCCNELNASTPGDATSMIRLQKVLTSVLLAGRLCSLSLWWNNFGRLT